MNTGTDNEQGVGTALFNLSPRHVGTAFAEGLASLIVRLARAHSVSPRRLVREVLGVGDHRIRALCYGTFFARYASTVNGLGTYARSFSGRLNELTGRDDLEESTTLLPWRNLFPPNGYSLTSSVRRWCRYCLSDMIQSGSEPYAHLLWSVATVSVCPVHRTTLTAKCPHCLKTQPIVPRWPDLTYCDFCRKSLVATPDAMLPPTDVQISTEESCWRSLAVADLIRITPLMPGKDLIGFWKQFLTNVTSAVTDGNRAEFCRRIGLQPHALNGWFNKGERPALEMILRILYAVQRWPSEVFASVDVSTRSIPCSIATLNPSRTWHRRTPRVDQHLVRSALKAAIRSYDPPSLITLARPFGLSRSGIKYRFPNLCRILTQRRAQRRRNDVKRHDAMRRRQIGKFVDRLMAQGSMPGRKLVEAEARRHGFSLMQSDYLLVYRTAVSIKPRF